MLQPNIFFYTITFHKYSIYINTYRTHNRNPCALQRPQKICDLTQAFSLKHKRECANRLTEETVLLGTAARV